MKTLAQATTIQQVIDCEFNIDISMFQNSELKRLKDKLEEFLNTGVETEDLTPMEDQ